MTRRQPSLSEAKRLLEWGKLGPDWVKLGPKFNNHEYWLWNCEPVASDITRRCFDCGCAIQDRRDGIGSYLINADNIDAFIQGRWSENQHIDVCISCFNRRLPRTRIMIEWNRNRKFINKAGRILNEHRKNSRSIEGTSLGHDGRRKKQQAGI